MTKKACSVCGSKNHIDAECMRESQFEMEDLYLDVYVVWDKENDIILEEGIYDDEPIIHVCLDCKKEYIKDSLTTRKTSGQGCSLCPECRGKYNGT